MYFLKILQLLSFIIYILKKQVHNHEMICHDPQKCSCISWKINVLKYGFTELLYVHKIVLLLVIYRKKP